MGVPAKLTEKQIKFAELLVYNEGRMSPAECAKEAGYVTRARQAASELRNPKYAPLVVRYIGELRAEVQEKYGVNFERHVAPLVVRYIGELRAEVQEKYGVNFERHVSELAKIRDQALKKGAWSAAVNAEVARGKAGGLYVDQKLIMTGNIDQLSEQEIEERMKQILSDHKDIIEGTSTEALQEKPEKLKKIKTIN